MLFYKYRTTFTLLLLSDRLLRSIIFFENRMTHLEHLEHHCGGHLQEPILDVGSGRGRLLCDFITHGYKAQGVEISADYIKITHELAASLGIVANVQQGVAEKLPYPDNMFGFINCSEVTEHVDDAEKALSEIHRVLKPGAKAYVSFHNRFGFKDYHYRNLYGINWMPRSWADRVCKLFGYERRDDAGIGRQKLSTMHYYTYSQLRGLLTKLGFDFFDTRRKRIEEKFPNKAVQWVAIGVYTALRFFGFNTFHLVLVKTRAGEMRKTT